MIERPFYKNLKDIMMKTYLNHIFLSANRYQFGWIGCMTGGVRCGKSMTLCTIADLLAKKPLDEYNIGFTPKEYLRSLDQCEIGEPIIWSEMGTALSARKWYTISNILIGEVIQTMMIKKPIVLIDTPDLSFIDVQARKLIYSFSESKRWEDSPVTVWTYRISIDRKTGDIFFPHPMLNINHSVCKLKSFKVLCKAPDDIWIKYNEKQMEYKEKLRKKNMKMIDRMDEELTETKATTYDYINKIKEDKNKYINKFGRLDVNLIRLGLKVSQVTAKEIKSFLDKEDADNKQ